MKIDKAVVPSNHGLLRMTSLWMVAGEASPVSPLPKRELSLFPKKGRAPSSFENSFDWAVASSIS
jgi:hypothetical protein